MANLSGSIGTVAAVPFWRSRDEKLQCVAPEMAGEWLDEWLSSYRQAALLIDALRLVFAGVDRINGVGLVARFNASAAALNRRRSAIWTRSKTVAHLIAPE